MLVECLHGEYIFIRLNRKLGLQTEEKLQAIVTTTSDVIEDKVFRFW